MSGGGDDRDCARLLGSIQSSTANGGTGAALKALAALMRDDFQLVDGFRRAGACEWVVQCMLAHPDDVLVAQSGCSAVLWMAFQNAPTSERLGKVGACDAVAAAMARFGQKTALVARYGSNAIGNLTADVDENAARFGLLGVCPLLVRLLEAHGTRDPYVAENVCYAVGNLVAVNEHNRVALGAESGVCEAVVAALVAYSQFDAVVANFACNAIGNLALTCGAKLGECGACKAVVECLERFLGEPQSHVALSGCYAVGNLAFDSPNNRTKLRECGACLQVVRCVQQPCGEDADVVNNAYYAIKRLASNHPAGQRELNQVQAWSALARRMETIKLSSAELDGEGLQALFAALREPGNRVTALELHAFHMDSDSEGLAGTLTHANNRLEQLDLRNVHMSDAGWAAVFKSFEHANNRVTRLSTGNSRADVDFVNLQFVEYFLAMLLGVLPTSSSSGSGQPNKYPKDGKFDLVKCLRTLKPGARAFVLGEMKRFSIRHHTFRTVVLDLIRLQCDTLGSFTRLETLSIAKLQVVRELKCLVHVVAGLEEEHKGVVRRGQAAAAAPELRVLLTRAHQEENQRLVGMTKDIDALFHACELRFDDGLLHSLLTNLKLKVKQVPPLSSLERILHGLRAVKHYVRDQQQQQQQQQQQGLSTQREIAAIVDRIQGGGGEEEDGDDEDGLLNNILALVAAAQEKKKKKGPPSVPPTPDDPYYELKMGVTRNLAALVDSSEQLAARQAQDACTFLEAQASVQHAPFAFLGTVHKEIDRVERELAGHVDQIKVRD